MKNIEKTRRALTAIATARQGASFKEIIESDRECFRGLHVTYATRATNLDIQDIRLDQIEAECPLLKSFFDGTGLLFYTDEIYRQSMKDRSPVAIDFSISFDKNVTDAIRLFVEGKQASQPENLYKLLHLVCGRGEKSFNYDFLAYLAEEFTHFTVEGNTRPIQTLRALKKLDYFAPDALRETPGRPSFNVSENEIDAVVQDTLKSLVFTEPMSHLQTRRLASHAVLLKAVLLSWQGSHQPLEALEQLVLFSLETLGKFPKVEIYFAWKLLRGAGKVPDFFAPIVKPSDKALSHLRGMSWDLTMFRMAEFMATTPRKVGPTPADFFVPFVASYDNKFRKIVDACPLRAIVVDHASKLVNLLFRDELLFQRDLLEASERVTQLLDDQHASSRRLSSSMDHAQLEQAVNELECEVQTYTA